MNRREFSWTVGSTAAAALLHQNPGGDSTNPKAKDAMKKIFVALASLLFAIASPAQWRARPDGPAPTLLVQNVTLIDGG